MAKKGLLERRVEGAVKAKEQFNDDTVKPKKVSGYINQKVSIKIPPETKKNLDVIKTINKIRYDYEAIQMLTDSYYHNLSLEDKKHFDLLKDNM